MSKETEKDELMRRYLLDEISDDERQRIEEKFLEDDIFFEEIAAFEDELLYEYKQNLLTPKQRTRFEEKFLKTPAEKEKAVFAEAFLNAADEIVKEKKAGNFRQSVAAFFDFSNSALRVGLAAAAILLVFSLGVLLFTNLNRGDIVVELPSTPDNQLPAPTATVIDKKIIEEKQKEQEELQRQLAEERRKTEQDTNKIREIQEKSDKLKREIEEKQRKNDAPPGNQTPPKTFVALILSPGFTNRGTGDAASRIKLAPEIKNLRLSLNSQAAPQKYRVVVRAIDDAREIWSNSVQKSRKGSFSLNLPTGNLQRGDYEISVIDPADNQEIETYYFSVVQ